MYPYKSVQPFELPGEFFQSPKSGLWVHADRIFGGWAVRATQLFDIRCGQTYGSAILPPYPSARMMGEVARAWLDDSCTGQPYSVTQLNMLDCLSHSPVAHGVAFLALREGSI